jgi:hypothetical protein
MTTPDAIERDLTLRSAAARLDELRMRTALGSLQCAATAEVGVFLEVLALSEVLIRKAWHGRQLDVRAARAAGASWAQIGAACGTSKQAAWEAHERWIHGQAELHKHADYRGLDPAQVQTARCVAGGPDD